MASSTPSSRRRPMSPSPPRREPGGAATFARPGARRRVRLGEALSAALECARRDRSRPAQTRHDLRLLGPAQFQILQRLAGAKQRRQEVIPDVLVGFRRRVQARCGGQRQNFRPLGSCKQRRSSLAGKGTLTISVSSRTHQDPTATARPVRDQPLGMDRRGKSRVKAWRGPSPIVEMGLDCARLSCRNAREESARA